jgi:2-amino-4-hydroxy-6-hydroxymethyldihydropteridine diphosphokinase
MHNTMNNIAYISIGSNLGDRIQNCTEALQMLHDRGDIDVLKVSSWYESPAEDVEGRLREDAPAFLNGAATVRTSLPPEKLLKVLMDVESALGRPRRRKKGLPRTIDLDLLLYEGEVRNEPHLILPHPSMDKRLFVLKPLYDIAPEAVDPINGKTVRDLLGERLKSENPGFVKRLNEIVEDSEGE